jgi:transcriptional regulator with XRE-family HTH domain
MSTLQNAPLTGDQIAAAQALAQNLSMSEAARRAGVTKRTVQRWANGLEEFASEVATRRALHQAGERLQQAKQVSQTGFNLPAAIADLREAKRLTRVTVREAGASILERCCERLQDLPIEAISPQLLPTLFRVGAELVQWSDQSESEELELSELTEQLLGPDSLTAQKVQVETTANIERVFAAIADCQDFTQAQKERIFQLIAGKNGND